MVMMPTSEPPRGDARRSDATLADLALWHQRGAIGVLLIATGCLLAALTSGEVAGAVPLYYVGSLAGVIVLWAVAGRSRSRTTLFVWPLAVLLGMSFASFLAPVAATLCIGSLYIAFLFVGLTQPRGSSLIVLLPAMVTYALIFDVPLQQLVVKMAIAAAVWIAVAEIPAWLTASLREARTEMERLAATDPLTGLANRRYWDEQLPQLLERNPFSVVLLIDLDHFKAFNDTHGHLAGDEMLIAFAQSIRRAMPAGDIASRWGGEEFALAVRDGVQARIVADEIRNNVPLGQTCSIGLAEHRPGEPVLELLRRADEALYAAKDGGRDRIVAA